MSRSIAESLNKSADLRERLKAYGGVDADIAEAAAYAHDLGHPPFGHIGEDVLDAAAIGLGLASGFEGNAQSFRIVTALECHNLGGAGLGLTYGTLAAILKYPWPRRFKDDGFPEAGDALALPLDRLRRKKFCCYGAASKPSEGDESWPVFTETMRLVPRDEHGRPVQSAEASIMDVADDITYAMHDLDDFYRSGLISRALVREEIRTWRKAQSKGFAIENGAETVLGKLAAKLSLDYPNRFHPELYLQATKDVLRLVTALRDAFCGQRDEIAPLQSMISNVITDCLTTIEVAERSGNLPIVHLAPLEWHKIEVLKAITRHFVVERPHMAGVQRGQALLLTQLVELVDRWVRDEPSNRIPSRLQDYLQLAADRGVHHSSAQARAVIDYIAGLTDMQATELHRVLKGGHLDMAGTIVQ